mmetsp:Transcript_2350/g.2409  ORF Transcript_2350/g.2409 Transcript_2350/m.2409 type:complete len:272 (-) Transcript_2350:361-1176(-)
MVNTANTIVMKMTTMLLLLSVISCKTDAFIHQKQTTKTASLHAMTASSNEEYNEIMDRRQAMATAASAAIATSLIVSNPQGASASGGATAGKYTTIPIAKRRYYGRVQEAVHEFLQLTPAIIAGDMTGQYVQTFFDPLGALIIPAKRKDINGICTKKDGNCKGQEIRDSRWNDMKTTMYLLGNAFRINQTKAPDNLPTVIAAKAFFKEINAMEKTVTSRKPMTNLKTTQGHFAKGLDLLDIYLDLVELPPTQSGHYDKEFSTLVGESSRIT